jgi:hypothetical protein
MLCTVRLPLWIAAVAAITLAASGCGASRSASKAPASSRPTAVVAGFLALSGGMPVVGSAHPNLVEAAAGTVRLTTIAGRHIDVTTNKYGKFSVRVPAGRYWIVGGLNKPGWPMGSCNQLSGAGVHYDPQDFAKMDTAYSLRVAQGRSPIVTVGCAAN